ncbi:uncharacterized protein [Clytia hemisphaerica]|uniref:FAM124 domain-containing protein n=2 Tax=Clytia hemisphaerica TaxID=252671 RepID=A0A7M5V698_9CNID
MRKESSFLYDSDSSDHYFEDDTPCCSLVILPGNRSEEDYLRSIYSRITTPSPVWKESISIETFKSNGRQTAKHAHLIPRCCHEEEVTTSNKTPTQSLSVNFILREELIGNEVHKIRRLFFNNPWKFHHTFQTYDVERKKVVAKQPYYELTEEYPLMSPSVCHQGSSVLRYNIFVKDNFDEMKYFYMDLLRSQPMYEEENFCYFTIFSKNGTEIQLSLKHSKQLHIVPTKRTFLKVHLDNLYETVHQMGAKIEEIFCSDCGILVTRDPEGNPILITGKNPSKNNPHSRQSSGNSTLLRRQQQEKTQKQQRRSLDEDVWSDCSDCSECLRQQKYNNNNNINNYRQPSKNTNKRASRYFYQPDQNDSGYHNDELSSTDEEDCLSFSPHSPKSGGTYSANSPKNDRTLTSQQRRDHSNCPRGITQLHFPTCPNTGCCDRYGRPFTCCVVNV